MKYRKMNKYEKKEEKSQKLANDLAGDGLYLFRNNTESEMTLPRPTRSGLRFVQPKAEFQGDNYYMQMVRTGLLRLVETLQTPDQQAAVKSAESANVVHEDEVQLHEQQESNINEGNMTEEKLILDQPETITQQGQVEHVVNNNTPIRKLNEESDEQPEDVLLNEGPCDDGFVIVDEN